MTKRADIRKVQQVLEKILLIDQNIALAYILTLIFVYHRGECHQIELERYLGSSATASRAVKYWSPRKRSTVRGKGYEYMTSYPDPDDERRKVVTLSDTGKAFFERL